MAIRDVRQSPIPFDRLTELADEMQKVAAAHPDVKGIICLSDEDHGGMVMFGFDDMAEGLAQLLIHLKAAFMSEDKEFGVMTDQGFMVL